MHLVPCIAIEAEKYELVFLHYPLSLSDPVMRLAAL